MAQNWRGSYYRYKEFFLNIVALYQKRADLKMFLEIILSLSTIIIFMVFALKPTVITIIDLVKEINSKKETISLLTEKINNLEIAQTAYQNELNSIPLINDAVPDKPSPEVYSSQIETLATNSSVKILGVSIGEAVLAGNEDKKSSPSDLKPFPKDARELAVSVSVSGSYQNLITFMKNVEGLSRPVKIDVLGISSSSADLEPVISIIITGRIPYIELK